MALEADRFRPRYFVRDPDLPDVVRFGRGRVALDHVLERAGEDFAVGVAGDARGWAGGEREDDRARDVCGGLGRHPAVVFVGGCVGGVWLGGCEGRGGWGFVVVRGIGVFALLAFLVAFKGEWLDHGGCGVGLLECTLYMH